MAKKPASTTQEHPAEATSPTTAEDFLARGWRHYSKKEYFRAESDFRKSIEIEPDQPDYTYALGLALQASGRPVDAVDAFEKLLRMIADPSPENRVRYHMIARLTRGHINLIKTGDWKLSQ